ncbi:MAG: proline--tRNA ligase [Verrucomicrobiota bacterium]|jgi:prolyl-tRNA synthetase|nr:proline--tRNA ligase [Verrucomicrobiota bacterium]
MRWSQTFIPTLKETPAEAEIISHKLLLRAGLVRKLTGGLYTFLPLGLRALRKVESIVRQEMNRAGALEVFMPALQPPAIWAKSGRLETAKDVLFHVKDRARKEWVLGPTHEEVITTLVADEFNSYRQLPVNFYQIQTKFRDEIRPRFGLMRAKEFIMKDAYSFDADDEAANASYQRMYDAYTRIFERCGLRAIPVQADTGVMGGAHSHEFMVPAETGENEVVYCESGEYAANMEKATSQGPATATPSDDCGAAEKFETPSVKTIDDLAKDFDVAAERQIKTLVYIADGQPVIVLLRGDDQLEEAKLGGALRTGTFRAAGDAEIAEALGAHPGSLGAVGVTGIPVYADEVLRGGSGMVTGANDDGHHLRNVNIERDITVGTWADLRQVRAGELCLETGQPLKIRRAIEVGHVFKLGTKYSEALGATFLDENGGSHPSIMGCYGIGVTRTLQAVIEQCHDDHGILWPTSVAPYEVCLTALDVKPESEVMKLADRLYDELQANGVDVILDDRAARPGIKFKDSELAGFPLRIGIGERSLAKGHVEIKPRVGEMILCRPDEALGQALDWLEANRVG